MISAAYSNELDEQLLWEWDTNYSPSMSDTSRPSKGVRVENELSSIRSTLLEIEKTLTSLATKDDLTGLKRRVKKVESDITLLQAKPTLVSRFWKERNWSIALLVSILSGCGWIFSLYLGHVIDVHTHELSNAVSHLGEKVSRVEGRLNIQSAALDLRELKSAPVDAIKKQAPQLQATRQQLADVKDKSLPNYWPTSFAVLRFASIAQSPNPEMLLALKNSNHVSNVTRPEEFLPASWILDGIIANCTFRDSLITFAPGVRLRNDLFINCIFVLPEGPNPPTVIIKNIGEQLLTASDLSNVRLSAG